jgi:hypothetical protein
VLDYMAYIWAQEAIADEAGVDIKRAGFAEAVVEDRRPGPLRRLGARVLRRFADRLDAGRTASLEHQ